MKYWLLELMQDEGLSSAYQLAKHSGISAQQISYMIKSEVPLKALKFELVVKLKDMMNCTFDELYERYY